MAQIARKFKKIANMLMATRPCETVGVSLYMVTLGTVILIKKITTNIGIIPITFCPVDNAK